MPDADLFSVILKCCDPDVELYFLSIARDRVTVASHMIGSAGGSINVRTVCRHWNNTGDMEGVVLALHAPKGH